MANQSANVNVPKYAFVILSDPGPLPQKLDEALDKYVQAGGSVLMMLGKNATPGRHLPIADLQVMGLHTIVPDHEALLTVASVDTSYPVFFARAELGWSRVLSGGQAATAAGFARIRAWLRRCRTARRCSSIARSAKGMCWCSHRLSTTSPAICRWRRSGCHSSIRRRRDGWNRHCSRELQSRIVCGAAHGARKKTFRWKSWVRDDKRLLTLAESTKARTFQFPSQGFFDIRRANGREELASVNADRRESRFCDHPSGDARIVEKYGNSPEAGAATHLVRQISVTIARNCGCMYWRC